MHVARQEFGLTADQPRAAGGGWPAFAGLYIVENSAVSFATLRNVLSGCVIAIGRSQPAEVEDRPAGAEEAADGVHTADELKGRNGHSAAFLGRGLPVPWPRLPVDMEANLVKPSDALRGRRHELRYTKFSVKFARTLRRPVLTAVNIDGEKSVRIKQGRPLVLRSADPAGAAAWQRRLS